MNIAVLLSGGKGQRMGHDIPKQYIRVSGKMLITYCLETLLKHPLIDVVQIVAEVPWREEILSDVSENGLDIEKICGFSIPGSERQSSIFHALEDIKNSENMCICGAAGNKKRKAAYDSVLIHDAVRPNLSREQITVCFETLKFHDGVMPVLPMKDTVYLSDGDGHISSLLDRERVFAGQAPEVFDFDKYYAANLCLRPDVLCKIKGSTEPAVMAGMDIAIVPGDENNYKITTSVDLERFRKQKEIDWQRKVQDSDESICFTEYR